MTEVTPPLNIAQLNDRLKRAADGLGVPVARARVMLCTLVVSQMLPEATIVKGGMGLKLRFGERGTRATSDLDVSTHRRGVVFENAFRARLAEGWGILPASKGEQRRDPAAPNRVAFTASLRRLKVHDPGLVHPEYVVHPYRVSIDFLGIPWGGLDVEVSDPEIFPLQHSRHDVDPELSEFSSYFGFGIVGKVTLVDLEYQIAQKLHAVTDPLYERAHDLVDLQLLWEAGPDLDHLHMLCTHTFRLRQQQSWPPLPLRDMQGWAVAYADARAETEINGSTLVLADLSRARTWLCEVIERIAAADTQLQEE